MKDVRAMMITRMTAVASMIKIQAVDVDDRDDANGRNERYCGILQGHFSQSGLH